MTIPQKTKPQIVRIPNTERFLVVYQIPMGEGKKKKKK
jgi:hypothetical protein